MPINRYFLSDFVSIQRQSFFDLLERGLIEEFKKRNPITNQKKDLSLLFYPEYYVLTRPEYTPQEAILKNKSYTSKLYVPAQLTDVEKKTLKWVYIGNIPLMTKRGHFILNGAARVIVNQILRSPGIYYQQKIYENTNEKMKKQKPEDSYKRFYADLICMRGTWLRIEMDKEKNIWAQMKKGPKIPIYWFLLAMGLSEKVIFKSILDSYKLIGNLENAQTDARPSPKVATRILLSEGQTAKIDPDPSTESKTAFRSSPLRGNEVNKVKKQKYAYLKNPPEAWQAIYSLLSKSKTKEKNLSVLGRKWLYNRFMNPRTYDLGKQGRLSFNRKLGLTLSENQTTLTGLDVLYATDYLIKVEKGIYKTDDIDHLKNRRVRTSGELIQIQVGVGLVRLEKSIRDAFTKVTNMSLTTSVTNQTSAASKFDKGLNETRTKEFLLRGSKNSQVKNSNASKMLFNRSTALTTQQAAEPKFVDKSSVPVPQEILRNAKVEKFSEEHFQAKIRGATFPVQNKEKHFSNISLTSKITSSALFTKAEAGNSSFHPPGEIERRKISYGGCKGSPEYFSAQSFINNKAFNSAMREFFGTSPLSQFMDQINPLAELTHKRRLSSMGPGGVTRDTATLAIRGIHPTHYGRICPIETPEGKNTGLVNSMTTYARVNPNGIIESPFYKVYKGQVQKNAGMYYFSAEQEEKIQLAAADLAVSSMNFLPKSLIPVRIAEDFTKIARSKVEYIGVSPLQMISIAASLIPFLEHDDANRALMGSNMQRQAVPLIRPERPIVGTGLEARAVSDSGHALQSKYSGLVTYVSGQKMIVYSLVSL